MSIGESVHSGGSHTDNKPDSLALGIVKENWSALHPGMVRVNILTEGGEVSLSDWMPVAMPYAANECGVYLMPEAGSTVIVGYIDDNSVSPVVIGSIWNKSGRGSTALPKDTANSENSLKVFCTAKGQMIKFDEGSKSQSVEIISGKKQRIFLDGANEKTVISAGDNTVTLDGKQGSISIEAKKAFSVKIGDKECISADSSGLSIKASKFSADSDTLALNGKQSKIEGSAIDIKSSGNLNIQSGGMAAVKGSMLKLN